MKTSKEVEYECCNYIQCIIIITEKYNSTITTKYQQYFHVIFQNFYNTIDYEFDTEFRE